MSLGPVATDERITVYLVHSTDFNATRPTYNAFMPAANARKSVYRTSALSHNEVRDLGKIHVEPIRGPLKGYGHQQAVVVFTQGLQFDPDGKPHVRHANIIGWSGIKAKDRITAQKLAESASLTVYPKS